MQHILNKFIYYLICCGISYASAQIQGSVEIKADTIALGNPFQIKGWVKYSTSDKLIYPDTANSFKPYEFIRYEATSIQQGKFKIDSFLYELRSFETAPTQIISLKFLSLTGRDTAGFIYLKDSFQLASRLPLKRDSLTVISHTDILTIAPPPDYTGWLLIILIAVFIIGLTSYLLYKPILKYLAKRKILIEFDKVKNSIKSLPSDSPEEYIYQLNRQTRAYLSDGLPLRLESLTTTELKRIDFPNHLTPEAHQFLLKISNLADEIIYANQTLQPTGFDNLKTEAIHLLQIKKHQLIRAIQL